MRLLGHLSDVFVRLVKATTRKGRLLSPLITTTALILQLFTSSMGQAADGTWIEICSDFGTSYVQVDLGDGAPAGQENCPDCKNCALCAADLTALVGSGNQHKMTLPYDESAKVLQARLITPARIHVWPETRGPPTAKIEKANGAFRAMTATNPAKGGAL